MTTTKELATFDEKALAELYEMAREDTDIGVSGGNSLPRLKINQKDTDCKHALGSWVIGLKVDQATDNIIDHGKKVVELVVLAMRNGYTFYNQKDTSKNCSSPLFVDFRESVYGSKYGFQCGRDCPNRAEGAEPRCAAQIVIYGIAITEDGEGIPCVFYARKSSYMAFSDVSRNYKKYTTFDFNGLVKELPLYAVTLKLDTKREKNGGVTYYAPVVTKGRFIGVNADGTANMDAVRNMREQHRQAVQAIEELNAKITGKASSGSPAPAAPTAKSVIDEDSAIDLRPTRVATASAPMDELPWDAKPTAPSTDDALEASLRAALRSS